MLNATMNPGYQPAIRIGATIKDACSLHDMQPRYPAQELCRCRLLFSDAAGPEAVRADAGERRVPVAGFPGALLQDQPDAFGGEGMAADRVAAADAPEHPAVPDAGGVQPRVAPRRGSAR